MLNISGMNLGSCVFSCFDEVEDKRGNDTETYLQQHNYTAWFLEPIFLKEMNIHHNKMFQN